MGLECSGLQRIVNCPFCCLWPPKWPGRPLGASHTPAHSDSIVEQHKACPFTSGAHCSSGSAFAASHHWFVCIYEHSSPRGPVTMLGWHSPIPSAAIRWASKLVQTRIAREAQSTTASVRPMLFGIQCTHTSGSSLKWCTAEHDIGLTAASLFTVEPVIGTNGLSRRVKSVAFLTPRLYSFGARVGKKCSCLP